MNIEAMDVEPRATRASVDWRFAAARAVPALVLAAVITFSADHSAVFGLITFGSWAVVDGIVQSLLARTDVPDRSCRRLLILRSALTLVAGVVALALLGQANAVLLQVLVLVWAVVTGIVELVAGLRGRREFAGAGDWVFGGAVTVLLAVALAVVPSDFRSAFSGEEGDAGVLTASVVEVGLIGAWAAILGLFQIIGAISLRRPSSASRLDA